MKQAQDIIEEMIKGVKYMLEKAMDNTTKIYDGIVVSENKRGRWNILFNGDTKPVKLNGSIHPQTNANVKVFVPQGNFSSAWFEVTSNPYPVGAIYISAVETEPEILFGGKWERIKGRFLLGADETYVAGEMKGEAEHTLSIEEIPAHDHYFNKELKWSNTSGGWASLRTGMEPDPNASSAYLQTEKTGGSLPHNNMPPYLAVFMWKRIS